MRQHGVSVSQMSELVERQQRRIAELERENHELRRQLDELRRGAGVSVVIGGRTIPLAALVPAAAAATPAPPLPATMPSPPSPSSLTTSARMPAIRPATAHSAPLPAISRSPTARPLMPSTSLPAPARPAAAPRDDGWLTGPVPAVREHRPHLAISAPAHRLTPSWLREEAPTIVAESAPPQHVPSHLQHHRPQPRRLSNGPISRPSVPRLQPATPQPASPFPTLAQITSRMRAVQPDPVNYRRGERNPYADSFVLD